MMVDRCESMFLGIKMLGDDLSGGKNLKQIQRIIDETPRGIEHIYDRNWDKITSLRESSRYRAFAILRWAAFAMRPLTVLEMTEALLLADEECDELSYEELPDSIDEVYVNTEILGLCGSLIEIREMEAFPDLGSSTVHLTHFSARQYILCHNLASTGELIANERLRSSNEAIQNNILAKSCLRYLNFPQVWDKTVSQNGDNHMTQAFQTYASNLWNLHVDQSVVGSEEVTKLVNEFFHPGNVGWESWRRDNRLLYQVEGRYFFLGDGGEMHTETRLLNAVVLGLEETVKYLVEEVGLDINQGDRFGGTALFAAAASSQVSMAAYLLQQGADVNLHMQGSWGPIHAATDIGDIEMLRLLIENGADLNITGWVGVTPLYQASRKGYTEIVELFLEKGADPDVSNECGETALLVASECGRTETVKLLLEKGCDLHARNYKNGWTPLHEASAEGHIETVELLLKKGADLRVRDNRGRTPLFVASEWGHTKAVKLLLEKGAELHVRNRLGDTPLHAASEFGRTKIVELFLEKGADLNVENKLGQTPCYLAAKYGRVDAFILLREQGG